MLVVCGPAAHRHCPCSLPFRSYSLETCGKCPSFNRCPSGAQSLIVSSGRFIKQSGRGCLLLNSTRRISESLSPLPTSTRVCHIIILRTRRIYVLQILMQKISSTISSTLLSFTSKSKCHLLTTGGLSPKATCRKTPRSLVSRWLLPRKAYVKYPSDCQSLLQNDPDHMATFSTLKQPGKLKKCHRQMKKYVLLSL